MKKMLLVLIAGLSLNAQAEKQYSCDVTLIKAGMVEVPLLEKAIVEGKEISGDKGFTLIKASKDDSSLEYNLRLNMSEFANGENSINIEMSDVKSGLNTMVNMSGKGELSDKITVRLNSTKDVKLQNDQEANSLALNCESSK